MSVDNELSVKNQTVRCTFTPNTFQYNSRLFLVKKSGMSTMSPLRQFNPVNVGNFSASAAGISDSLDRIGLLSVFSSSWVFILIESIHLKRESKRYMQCTGYEVTSTQKKLKQHKITPVAIHTAPTNHYTSITKANLHYNTTNKTKNTHLQSPKISHLMFQNNLPFHPRTLIHFNHIIPRQYILPRRIGMHTYIFITTHTQLFKFCIVDGGLFEWRLLG